MVDGMDFRLELLAIQHEALEEKPIKEIHPALEDVCEHLQGVDVHDPAGVGHLEENTSHDGRCLERDDELADACEGVRAAPNASTLGEEDHQVPRNGERPHLAELARSDGFVTDAPFSGETSMVLPFAFAPSAVPPHAQHRHSVARWRRRPLALGQRLNAVLDSAFTCFPPTSIGASRPERTFGRRALGARPDTKILRGRRASPGTSSRRSHGLSRGLFELDGGEVSAARADEVMDLRVTDVDVWLHVPPVTPAGGFRDRGPTVHRGFTARANVHLLHTSLEAEPHGAQDDEDRGTRSRRMAEGERSWISAPSGPRDRPSPDPKWVRPCAAGGALLVLFGGCLASPEGTRAALDGRSRGSFVATTDAEWPERSLRPMGWVHGNQARALSIIMGEVAILEGEPALVSGVGTSLGLRFDEERNDLAAVTARYARDVGDRGGMLVLFTTFDDRGASGPAYFVPIFNDVLGTGLGVIDQRAEFHVSAIEAVINMKRLDEHAGDRALEVLAHEVAHRHLAYMEAEIDSSTAAVPFYGRQHAHWRAALDTAGSIMGGYGWLETTRGRFVVTRSNDGFSELDLYGLGLREPSEVPPFFLILNARTEAGFALPDSAELTIGSRAVGDRIDLAIDDVIRALGRRRPPSPSGSDLDLTFALLTAPGEAATSTGALDAASRIDGLRRRFEAEWPRLTLGRGRVCTVIRGCLAEAPPDGGLETNDRPHAREEGCACAVAVGDERAPALGWIFLLGLRLRRRPLRPS